MPEWDAERVVSPELALELVREQFPGLGRAIEPFGSGWDNTAYLVDGDLVFRFPRRSIAVPLIETEARVLPRIAPHLPLPIPCPEWAGAPTERFPWPFGGYRMLFGQPAIDVDLSPEERRATAGPLAGFLRALHTVSTDGLELPGDEFRRTDLVSRMPLLVERLGALESAGIVADGRPWLRLFEAGDFPAPSSRSVPVHGDLDERHVLVDEANRVCGVFDWGDVHAGDPGLDLSLLYLAFPVRERGDFLRIYGDADARTLRMARLRAAFHAVSVAFYAQCTRDAPLLRRGLTSMEYLLED